MKAERIREILKSVRLLVIHRERDAGNVLLKARACREGGILIQEITWTTPGAGELIRELRSLKSGIIGAGSILTATQAKEAAAAGAQFLVSPVFTQDVATFARRHKMLYLAGACSPQEVYDAWKAGSRPVKLFPCAELCSPAYLKRLLGPMPFLELLPTGVGLDHIRPYLDAGATAVGLGNPFMDAAKDGPALALLAARACDLAKSSLPSRASQEQVG
ncbi:MAG: bifunctional 4-hydroxy-2-oxoglutarate aldolase/2-dehydro-3-deoxy-phosphogluconate aldolase [Planctomycetes bacterium]|nr:bifunctional 4-hydroxy-2-oxoglutarate aldolase/2-dehydro-3-deoxy-phosphogluconate aldolase [Planctomycetota bacterium]